MGTRSPSPTHREDPDCSSSNSLPGEMRAEASVPPLPQKDPGTEDFSPCCSLIAGGALPASPSLAWTHKAELFGVEVKWLMGKGQSRDIFGVKTPPPTH